MDGITNPCHSRNVGLAKLCQYMWTQGEVNHWFILTTLQVIFGMPYHGPRRTRQARGWIGDVILEHMTSRQRHHLSHLSLDRVGMDTAYHNSFLCHYVINTSQRASNAERVSGHDINMLKNIYSNNGISILPGLLLDTTTKYGKVWKLPK